jgi:hypothetical protein
MLRTRDGGKTWTSIALGIPIGSYVNAVREDPERRGLLYAGTETGVFVSFDAGDHWQALQGNLPSCSVRDLSVSQGDLVIATHGRSFWILDDLSSLRQLDAKAAAADAWLFEPRPAIRLNPAPFQGTPDPRDEPLAENPPAGAILDYWLRADARSPVTIEIRDARGEAVRRFAGDEPVMSPDLQRIQVTPDWVAVAQPPSGGAGMHRFLWDLRYGAPAGLRRQNRLDAEPGVRAPPGRYTVRLNAGGRSLEQPLVVSKDPRVPASDADLLAQFELAREVEAQRVRVDAALSEAETLRKRLAAPSDRPAGARAAVDAFAKTLEVIAGPSPDSEAYFDESRVEPTNLRRLSGTLARFQRTVESADAAPTPDALTGFRHRRADAEAGLSRWREFLNAELPPLNAALESAGLRRVAID